MEYVHRIAPAIAAEDVPLPDLVATQPPRRMPLASSFIEQSFHGRAELLDLAEPLIAESMVDDTQRFRAYIYDAYMPLFNARSENRYPDRDELLDTFGYLHTRLAEYASFITQSDEQIFGRFDMPPQAWRAQRVRNTVASMAGEAVTLYLSLYGSLSNGSDVLYPSSFREDNPPDGRVIPYYKRDLHDSHTYNPSEPSNRIRVSVKTARQRISGRGETAVRFRVLQHANKAYAAALPEAVDQLPPDLGVEDVIDLLLQAEAPTSVGYELAKRFRDLYVTSLTDLITPTQADEM